MLRSPISRALLTSVLAVALVVSPFAPAPAVAGMTTIWSDAFARTVAQGWGSGYVSRPATDASVSSGSGVITVRAAQRSIHESTAVQPADAVVGATLRFSQVPTAGYGATGIVTARNGSSGAYGARFRLDTQSRGVLSLARYDGEDRETVLRQDLLLIAAVPAGSAVRVEIETSGTQSVQVRARAWLAGSATPAWQVTATDDSASAVRTSGAPGVQTYMSAGNPTVSLRVDDLSVSTVTTATPTPTPTATSTPTPTPTPTPTLAPLPAGGVAGSAAIGRTSYGVPSGALYVVPAGSRVSGVGTAADPIAGVQRAIDTAATGATLVLRGGTYRESIAVPFSKKLTIQSAPAEAVWFDGSRPVTGWAASGSTWVVPWGTFFDSRVSFSAGQDETSWWVNPSYPMAGHPDQVWLDGARMTQVGSRTAVTAGTFFVDQQARQLVIGSDPTGRRVEASVLAKAIKIQGAGTTIRGIGVQRYATTTAMLGAVSAEVAGITLENMVIRDNATVGLFAWNDDKVFRYLTVSGNGMLGIAVNRVRNLKLLNSIVSGNNTSRFNYAPVAGGVKMSRATNVTVSQSIISDNVSSTGLWFDISSSNLVLAGNVLARNGREGLEIELSQTALVAGNHIVGNRNNGVFVFDSGNIDIWNNTLVGNVKSITYMQDERRQEDPYLSASIPWITSDVVVRNNLIAYGSGPCPLLTQDLTRTWYGNDFGVSQDANLYHRASASTPVNFACWAAGANGTRAFTTIEEFRSHTGGDRASVLLQGTAVVDPSTWQLTVANPVSGAYALSTRIATVMGVSLDTRTIGAPRAPTTVR